MRGEDGQANLEICCDTLVFGEDLCFVGWERPMGQINLESRYDRFGFGGDLCFLS